MFYKSARMWMVRTVGRIILSGFFSVEFRDFFLTDLLCSMVKINMSEWINYHEAHPLLLFLDLLFCIFGTDDLLVDCRV
jgi:hypothetical protein